MTQIHIRTLKLGQVLIEMRIFFLFNGMKSYKIVAGIGYMGLS